MPVECETHLEAGRALSNFLYATRLRRKCNSSVTLTRVILCVIWHRPDKSLNHCSVYSPVGVTYTYRAVLIKCRKVIEFTLTTPHDWLKKTRVTFSSNDSFAHVFPRFASATCYHLEF